MAHDNLEPLADGFVGFRTESGERWKHKDVEDARVGPGYRLFIADDGEERRYTFGPHEPHDATLFDLREQLKKAQSAPRGESPRADAPRDEMRA